VRRILDDGGDDPIGATSFAGPQHTKAAGQSGLERLREALSGLDLIIGIVLAAMLLPLLLFPFFILYWLIEEGSYRAAGAVGLVVLAFYVLVGRDVRRGEFSPYTVVAVFATAIVVLGAAARFLL